MVLIAIKELGEQGTVGDEGIPHILSRGRSRLGSHKDLVGASVMPDYCRVINRHQVGVAREIVHWIAAFVHQTGY